MCMRNLPTESYLAFPLSTKKYTYKYVKFVASARLGIVPVREQFLALLYWQDGFSQFWLNQTILKQFWNFKKRGQHRTRKKWVGRECRPRVSAHSFMREGFWTHSTGRWPPMLGLLSTCLRTRPPAKRNLVGKATTAPFYMSSNSLTNLLSVLVSHNLLQEWQEEVEVKAHMITISGRDPRDAGNGPVKLLLSTSLNHWVVREEQILHEANKGR